MSRLQRIMDHYTCSKADAQRFIDLRDEGYSLTESALMAGLSDPPEHDAQLLGDASPHDPPPPAANPVPSDVQRDADRYRFLKNYDKNCEDLAICKWSDTGWSGEWVVEHDPDAVIDAALTKKAQQ